MIIPGWFQSLDLLCLTSITNMHLCTYTISPQSAARSKRNVSISGYEPSTEMMSKPENMSTNNTRAPKQRKQAQVIVSRTLVDNVLTSR